MKGEFTATLDFAGPFKFESKPVEMVVGETSDDGESEDGKSGFVRIIEAFLAIAGIALAFKVLLSLRKKQQD